MLLLRPNPRQKSSVRAHLKGHTVKPFARFFQKGTLGHMLQPPPASPGARFRELISHGIVLMPGVFNAISAVSAHKAGAKALYLSGAGLTNANLGMPDVALGTLTEFSQVASYISQITPVPV